MSWAVEGWRAERGACCEMRKWSVWDWRNPYFRKSKAVDDVLGQEEEYCARRVRRSRVEDLYRT